MRDVTLAILAGGESSRMGSPKAGIQIRGQPILHWLLEAVEWRGPTLLVTAPGREAPAGADGFDCEVCDPVAGMGPLRGILTAMENSNTPTVVVATVDMPGIRSVHLEWIIRRLIVESEVLGIMFVRQLGLDRAIEPFPSAYRTSAAPILAERLAQQRRAVHGLLTIDRFHAVDAPAEWSARTWTNLNTPEEFAAFMCSIEAAG